MKLVITDWQTLCSQDEFSIECFRPYADEIVVYPYTKPEDTAERIGDADLLICNKTRITAEVMQRCPNLKYIGLMATGYNNIDIEAARAAGITVCNAGTYSTDAVAQYVFAQMLYHFNSIHLYEQDVRDGGWINAPVFSYFAYPLGELTGKTLAVIGYGSIGRQVAKIGESFGMKVIVATRTTPTDCPYPLVSIDEAFAAADVLTIHTPLTPQTERMVNAERLSAMKPEALLINAARGGVVDEEALAEALKNGTLAAAALDVLNQEPMSADTPLANLPNCRITPHIAWAPLETRSRLLGIIEGNLAAFLKGCPTHVVS